jgi:SAM-dependent methyltransferase
MPLHQEWFEEWFNSPYYHVLYDKRDEEEASHFIENLINFIKPVPTDVFLDLACGRGRHALKINSLGYTTQGIDLSEESIDFAKQFESENLTFSVGDMRHVFMPDTYNYVFNLFTSFGYFSDLNDNKLMLRAIHAQLLNKGQLVIDFLNFNKIRGNFPKTERIVKGKIQFDINKRLDRGRILKEIKFSDQGVEYHFVEKLQAIDKTEMLALLESTGFELKTIWGDYGLNPYDEANSDRLIVLAEKRENV